MVLPVGLLGCGEPDSEGGSGSEGASGSQGDASSGGETGAVGGSTTSSGAAETSGGADTSSTGSTVESCGSVTDAAMCEASVLEGQLPCTWLELTGLDADSCAPGVTVGFCVEAVGEPGCGSTPGCSGEALHAELEDGSIAPFTTCGGPYPPVELESCTPTEDGFDPPECACVCDGSGTGTDTD